MNNLSLLIYLADVAGDLNSFFVGTTFISIVVFLIVLVAAIPMAEEHTSKDEWELWRKWFLGVPIVFCVSFILSALTPSQETVYAIAASEMGEELVQSETGGKAVDALNSWLDSQIEEEE